MVAASKMKKAQDRALEGKPYADKIYQATIDLAQRVDIKLHPLLNQGNPKGKAALILISTNKGLCGGLNTNLFRQVLNQLKSVQDIDSVTLGKKGQSFVVRTKYKLAADFSDQFPFAPSIPAVTDIIIKGFISGIYKQVYVAYNSFINALKQEPVIKRILPLSLPVSENQQKQEKTFNEFLLEPSAGEILSSLLPHYLENQLRSAVFEAEASEHSARMIAMKNATEAASDVTNELTLLYNKARQEKITYEIADIVTARLAVEE